MFYKANQFAECWMDFEKKHLKSYTRWRKITRVKGGYEVKSLKKDNDFEKRVHKVFLYYLIYGEINDFRNLKNVLNLFYHYSLERLELQNGTPKVITFIILFE